MVASKKVHCAYCQKKCSGSVLRYQDQYYHKQCFELLQSELATAQSSHSSSSVGGQRPPELYIGAATTTTGSENSNSNIINGDLPRPQQKVSDSETSKPTEEHQHHYYRSKTSETTTTTTTKQQKFLNDNKSIDNRNLLSENSENNGLPRTQMSSASYLNKGQTLEPLSARSPTPTPTTTTINQQRSATLPHSISVPSNGFLDESNSTTRSRQQHLSSTQCAGCKEKIRDGQALIALDLHWHVWCFKCSHCKIPLHGEYVAKDGRAYCEKDYQKLFGITCVYCKRYITGKVLQAGEAHHFHPSCARCSKCGDPFVPGEEMYLQGEVTWHPRCGPGPGGLPLIPSQINDSNSVMEPGDDSALESTQSRSQLRATRAHSPSLSSRSRSASPFSYMSRQYDRNSPAYTESEPVGDLSRIYTISYLNDDPNQGYLKRPLEPYPPKSPQFSRPTSLSRVGGTASDRSHCSSRSQQLIYSPSSVRERSVPPPRGMYSVLSSMGRSGTSSRARSPSMMNEEAIQLAAYPSGQKPSPDSVPKIERDDFPAPPFLHSHQSHHRQHRNRGQSAPRSTTMAASQDGPIESTHIDEQQHLERASRPRSREFGAITTTTTTNSMTTTQQDACSSLSSNDDDDAESIDPQFRKEEEELSKIANGIGKIFLQTLKEREKLRAWKRSNLDPRNASRTPSATRELPSRPLRYDNPTNASPSRDLNRPRPWDSSELNEDLGGGEHSPTRTRSSLSRATATTTGPPQSTASSTYGYKVVQANRSTPRPGYGVANSTTGVGGYGSSVLNGASELSFVEQQRFAQARAADLLGRQNMQHNHVVYGLNRPLASSASAHLRRSMPNVANSRDSTLSHYQHLDGPPKLYPYHLLATTNYRLPSDVDRCHLERHLSNEEFQYIFHCDRLDFYRLPEWKRNELKRRAKLF